MKKHVLSAVAVALLSSLGLAAQAQTQVFQQWPMTRNNQDSAAVRSGVTASAPTLRKFVVSDGSATATVPAYSNLVGQAIAPQAVGTGWSSNATPPGTGSSLKRTFYEQFTVTAAAGSTVRADSVILTAGFLGTASGTNMGVVYSRSSFTADSTDVTGGKGPNGVFSGVVTGGFAGPVALAQVSTGAPNTNTYRLALNGATGVTLNAGQTLTIRVYFSCSSSGAAARFALLKNVIVKSRQAVVSATKPLDKVALGIYPNPTQNNVVVSHPVSKAAATIAVYAADGRKVASFVALPNAERTNLNIGSLTNGIYLVEYTNDRQRSVSKIVKE
ncbi:T9SS type A sorting domain-containing protein [Hymenobacter busanensis]|nr:T9SS type A sorting domain-containing protein [Hymenobacter busanensis]QHJ07061.1 T9SS type A sorting domain-containing protein [Hymenobacter busanensis]